MDGTLLEAWAGQKSFRRVDDNHQSPIDGTGEGSNPTVNFHREKRSNQTHCSTTDPDAMQSRKSRGSGAVLAYRGHLLTENRNGLVVSTLTTRAHGSAERDAALLMAEGLPGTRRVTLGADEGESHGARVFSRTGAGEPGRTSGCTAKGISTTDPDSTYATKGGTPARKSTPPGPCFDGRC